MQKKYFALLCERSELKKLFLLLLSRNEVNCRDLLGMSTLLFIASLVENPISSSIKDQAGAILW